MSASTVSVVVIGRNEGGRLERCLQSIRNMEAPETIAEVIYVDSASTDGSVDLASRLGARVIALPKGRTTAALGRNAGWRVATAPFILFLDGDTILHPRFVLDSLPEFQQETAIVWGHRREIHTERSLFNRVLDLDWIYPPGITEFCGGDALVRRQALQDVEGFDEHLIAGEEPEMCRRMRSKGWEILHVDRPMTGHDLAMTAWSQYWKRATRAGYAYAEVSQRFRKSGLPFWEEDARRNRNRALIITGAVGGGLLASLLLRSLWPVLMIFFLLIALVVRTALKAAWKSSSLTTRLAYAVHSHFQQIPIFLGQLQYARDRKSGARRGLIEYKETPR
jgi:cellulose synthase/poly-beta-1,6-N-acetylglucosamine synthase-like glycosyltransferase